MKLRTLIIGLVMAVCFAGQEPDSEERKLPSGKSQREEILRAEHDKTLRNLDEIVKLANELKSDLEKKGYQVLSVSSLKKADEIEKLAHQLRSRLKRF